MDRYELLVMLGVVMWVVGVVTSAPTMFTSVTVTAFGVAGALWTIPPNDTTI
jgi:hypothetical protein